MNAFTKNVITEPWAQCFEHAPESLRIESLNKVFGNFTALQSIDLSIQEGEFVCFLGPSGCGKTTLLRAIAGLELQTSGRIIQNGKDVSQLPPQARDFGIVFQSYALFPNLTVAQNVAYGLHNLRHSKAAIRARVDELLQLIGLDGSQQKYPAQLSGGQQQRVALARALATKPGLLLLDEPLSALDAQVRVHLRQQIKKLQQELGVTTVMVTHDQEEALTLADRIVVMNHGVIEQVGTPQEIYLNPANAFVASFVGSMNLLSAQSEGSNTCRLGSHVMQTSTRPLEHGSTLTLGIRPEEIILLNSDNADSTPNTLTAVVDDVEYLGAFLRVKCTPDGLIESLIVDLTLADWQHIEHVGKRITLQLPVAALRVFAEAGEQA